MARKAMSKTTVETVATTDEVVVNEEVKNTTKRNTRQAFCKWCQNRNEICVL